MAMVEVSTIHRETDSVSHSARTAIVPVANPDNAPTLLQLIQIMMSNTGGRIVVLFVLTEETRADHPKIAALRSIVETFDTKDNHFTVELVTRRAPSVVDGILEISNEYDTDMILLGLAYSVRGQVELGRIVETVAERAPCDVLVYRGPNQPRFDRVVVPVGGSIASRITLQMGIRLASECDLPIESLHVYNGSPEWDARAHVERLLVDLPGREQVNVNVVPGVNEANSVLAWANESDMLVVGFSERSRLEKWLYGDTAQRILDRAGGPVLMVARAIDDADIQALARRRLSWLRPLLTDGEQEHITWQAKDTAAPTLDYFVLLLIASLLASLGLLLNSSAVVIGAMLVAPLMQPIIAFGVGLCTARLRLVRQAAVTVLLGTFLALGVGVVTGFLIPPETVTDEMLARAYPSLLDAAVALAAGFIGAYATARKDIPAALAGVAIAAALVPPICTVGLSLALGELRLALGAALLFTANIICIAIIGAGVFYWMGMNPTRLESGRHRRRYASLLAALIIVLSLIGGMLTFTQRPSIEKLSTSRLQAVFAPAELTDLEIAQHDPLLVVIRVRTVSELPSGAVGMARSILAEDLGTPPRLRVVIERTIDGPVEEAVKES